MNIFKKVKPTMAETILDNDDESGNQRKSRESLTPSDVGGQNYIDFTAGSEVIMEVDDIERNYDARYTLSFDDPDQEPYAIEITDKEGDTVSLNAWSAWGPIQAAIREAVAQNQLSEESFDGLTLHLVNHEANGEYTVKWKAGDMDEFEEVDDD